MTLNELLSKCTDEEQMIAITYRIMSDSCNLRRILDEQILNSEVTEIKTGGCAMLFVTTSYRSKDD